MILSSFIHNLFSSYNSKWLIIFLIFGIIIGGIFIIYKRFFDKASKVLDFVFGILLIVIPIIIVVNRGANDNHYYLINFIKTIYIVYCFIIIALFGNKIVFSSFFLINFIMLFDYKYSFFTPLLLNFVSSKTDFIISNAILYLLMSILVYIHLSEFFKRNIIKIYKNYYSSLILVIIFIFIFVAFLVITILIWKSSKIREIMFWNLFICIYLFFTSLFTIFIYKYWKTQKEFDQAINYYENDILKINSLLKYLQLKKVNNYALVGLFVKNKKLLNVHKDENVQYIKELRDIFPGIVFFANNEHNLYFYITFANKHSYVNIKKLNNYKYVKRKLQEFENKKNIKFIYGMFGVLSENIYLLCNELHTKYKNIFVNGLSLNNNVLITKKENIQYRKNNLILGAFYNNKNFDNIVNTKFKKIYKNDKLTGFFHNVNYKKYRNIYPFIKDNQTLIERHVISLTINNFINLKSQNSTLFLVITNDLLNTKFNFLKIKKIYEDIFSKNNNKICFLLDYELIKNKKKLLEKNFFIKMNLIKFINFGLYNWNFQCNNDIINKTKIKYLFLKKEICNNIYLLNRNKVNYYIKSINEIENNLNINFVLCENMIFKKMKNICMIHDKDKEIQANFLKILEQ